MELLIAILMKLGLYANSDMLSDDRFVNDNQAEISKAKTIMDTHSYEYTERGGIVITGGVGG